MNKIKYPIYGIVLLLALITACRPKQEKIVIVPDAEKNHLQRTQLKGKVNIITTTLIYITEIDSALTKSDTVSTNIQLYSPDGYLLKTYSLNAGKDTLLSRIIHYRKDAKEDYWEEFDSAGKRVAWCKYEYDMNNYKSGEKIYQNDSLECAIQYKTDGIGNIIRMTRDYFGYKLTNTMKYNSDGLVCRIDEFEPDGKLFKYVTLEYDNYGDEVNRRAFKSANNIIEYTYTQYDEQGRLIKIIYEDRLHKFHETYEYSGHDKQGNWKKEIRKKASNVSLVRERTIVYY